MSSDLKYVDSYIDNVGWCCFSYNFNNIEIALYYFYLGKNEHIEIMFKVKLRSTARFIINNYSNWDDLMNSKFELVDVQGKIFTGFRSYLRRKSFQDRLKKVLLD